MQPAEPRFHWRWLGLGALALLPVLLLAALWFGPRLTDWDTHRDRLAILAAGRLGQPVTLAGPVKLTLLPQPMLEAGGVTIGGADSTLSITARALRLRLDLSALLRLKLEPREVALVGAEIRLPWPPAPGQAFRPPPWLTGLRGRIQDSRIVMGQVTLERVEAELAAGNASDALRITGRFGWRKEDVTFDTTIGRPGWDGIAPLALTLAAAKASVSTSGLLLPEGGFEGSLQGGGSDLAALMPAPGGSFRLRGRLSVTTDLLTADELALDIAGSPVRGVATLRLAPTPRLDLALVTGRVELDPWIAALRSAGPLALPFGLDLSAEAAGFHGLTLRRLRGAAFLEGERLTLTDVGAILPGDTEVELAGATTGRLGSGRLEAALHFKGSALRATLLALGAPLEGTDPARLREGEGRLRLTLDENQAAIPEFNATIDGARVSGAGVLRFGTRPALGLGLNFERLDLDGWLPAELGWNTAQARLAAIDANLRMTVEQARWRGIEVQGLSADAALEDGRLTARRVTGKLAGADMTLSGVLQLGAAPRLSDLALEVTAPRAAPLLALLPGAWPDAMPIAASPLALRLSGGGTLQAMALRGGLDLAELRLETNGMLDMAARRYAGALTLRHPGAPRLWSEALGQPAPAWLGEGSLSLITNLAVTAQSLQAESFDLVAAGLRARGQLALAMSPTARPRLTGRLAAERLPLPAVNWRRQEPLDLSLLSGLDAEVAISAARIEPMVGRELEQATAALKLEAGVLRLDAVQASLFGGRLQGRLRLDSTMSPPVLTLEGGLSGLALAAPLSGLPLDLSAGQLEAQASLRAAGHSPAALLATLVGEARLGARNGVLNGADLPAALDAADLPTLSAAEAGLRRALQGGATGFEALDVTARIEGGRALLESGSMAIAERPGATLRGEIDLARGGLDLTLALPPGQPREAAPAFGVRLTGGLEVPSRVVDIAAWLRWRAAE